MARADDNGGACAAISAVSAYAWPLAGGGGGSAVSVAARGYGDGARGAAPPATTCAVPGDGARAPGTGCEPARPIAGASGVVTSLGDGIPADIKVRFSGVAGVVGSLLLDGTAADIGVRSIAGDAGVVGSLLLDGIPADISVRLIAGDAGVVTSALASDAARAAPRPIAGDAGVVASLADDGLSRLGDDGRAPGVEMRTCSGFDEIVGPEPVGSSVPRNATGVAATVGPVTSDAAGVGFATAARPGVAADPGAGVADAAGAGFADPAGAGFADPAGFAAGGAGFAGSSFSAREPSGDVERVPLGGVAVGLAGAGGTTGMPRGGVAGAGVRSCSAEPQASVAARAGAERALGIVLGTPDDGVLVADGGGVAVCWMFCT